MFAYFVLINIINANIIDHTCHYKQTEHNYSSIADNSIIGNYEPLYFPPIKNNDSDSFMFDHVTYYINSIECQSNNSCNVTFFHIKKDGFFYKIISCHKQCSFTIQYTPLEAYYLTNDANLVFDYTAKVVVSVQRCNNTNKMILFAIIGIISIVSIFIILIFPLINCNFNNNDSDNATNLMNEVCDYGTTTGYDEL